MTAEPSYRTMSDGDAPQRAGTAGDVDQSSLRRRIDSTRRLERPASLNLAALALFAAPMRLLGEPVSPSDFPAAKAGEAARGWTLRDRLAEPVSGTHSNGHRGYDR